MPLAVSYVRIRAIAIPGAIIQSVCQALCLGIKDSKNPMYSVFLAAFVNFSLDLVCCSLLDKGIAGAAWATLVSQYCAAALLLRVLAKRGSFNLRMLFQSDQSGRDERNFTWTLAKKVFTFLPFLFVMLMKMTMHNSAAATAAALGGAEAAAHTALFAVAMTCFTFGDVGSSTSQAFLPAFMIETPNKVGGSFALEEAKPTIRAILQTTVYVSMFVSGLAATLVRRGANAISSDAAVVSMMYKALPLIVATLGMHGSAVTLEGLLLAQVLHTNITFSAYSSISGTSYPSCFPPLSSTEKVQSTEYDLCICSYDNIISL